RNGSRAGQHHTVEGPAVDHPPAVESVSPVDPLDPAALDAAVEGFDQAIDQLTDAASWRQEHGPGNGSGLAPAVGSQAEHEAAVAAHGVGQLRSCGLDRELLGATGVDAAEEGVDHPQRGATADPGGH